MQFTEWLRMMRASTFLWTRRHVYKGGTDALIATKAKSFYLRMQIPHNLVPQISIQGNGGGGSIIRSRYSSSIVRMEVSDISFKAMFKKTMFTLCWRFPPTKASVVLWGSFVSTVGVNEEQVVKYVRWQQKKDQESDGQQNLFEKQQ
jgi:hypothetical protein